MNRLYFAAPLLALMLLGCGGGDTSAPPPPLGGVPAPAPTPTPTPTPTASPSPQATPNYIHVFGIEVLDGAQPDGPPIQANDGNFYGITMNGGDGRCMDRDNACGTVYRLTVSGDYSVVYSFQGAPFDGGYPNGRLIQARDGALYGVTNIGGKYDRGVAYRLTLDGDYTVLHSFRETQERGENPLAGLVEGNDGVLYGTTPGGGANNCTESLSGCGTFFSLTKDGHHQVLHSFGNSEGDGTLPMAGLQRGTDGNFYGTTNTGGNPVCGDNRQIVGCGTVFRMTPTGVMTVLYRFGESPEDGRLPQGELTVGEDGFFYGVTAGGGTGTCSVPQGCGTVFRISESGQYSNIYQFAVSDGKIRVVNGRNVGSMGDGYSPSSLLALGPDGNFYGTTHHGGDRDTTDTGTIFRITPEGKKTTLYSFRENDREPSSPQGLIFARDGKFYGTTIYNNDYGSVGVRLGAGTLFNFEIPD